MLEDEEFRAFLKALGGRIRTIRKDKSFDMRYIMITSGYYDAQWRKYEAGGSLNLQSLLKIALTLAVPLNELFDGLGQWPTLSVGEIEKRRIAKLNLPKSVVEPEQVLATAHPSLIEPARKTMSSQSVSNSSNRPRKTIKSTKTRAAQKSKSLPGRKSTK